MQNKITFPDKRIVIRSDYGRWTGWDVVTRGNMVCTLCYHSNADMFWDYYAISSPPSMEMLYSDEFWASTDLKYVSRIHSSLVATSVICRWCEDRHLIAARGLFVLTKLSFLDRIRLAIADLVI